MAAVTTLVHQLRAAFRVRLIFVRHGESIMNTSPHLLGKRQRENKKPRRCDV